MTDTRIKVLPCPKSKKEPEMFLKLRENYDGVSLIACDKDGKRIEAGTILTITENGVYRNCDVSKDVILYFGFEVFGKIRIKDITPSY